MGVYTINPILIKNLLTPFESYVFDMIVHFEDIKYKYISYSLIEIYTCLSKNTIPTMRNNLLKMNFITVVCETKKGTVYKIEWDVLYNILKKLNEESNTYKRLLIADKYRTGKGLKSISKSQILKFKKSPFDFKLLESKKSNENKTLIKVGIKKQDNSLLNRFNEIQIKLDEPDIIDLIKNNLNNELNSLKKIAKSKNKIITYNKEAKEWIQKN